jgi:feruloyl esterase
VGPLLAAFGGGFFRDLVFGKPEFDLRTLNFDQDLAVADWRTGRDLNATDTNLGRFKALGGKLIQYHGWNDSAIAPRSSIDWYQAVAQRQGGLTGVQSFYRLFMAPGMQHCGLGDGPNAVGGVFGLPAPAHDAEHDVVAALAHWVEDGAAPARIVATRYTENDPAKGVAAQRPWCPWPQIARYAGQGSRAEAASYACAAPPSP